MCLERLQDGHTFKPQILPQWSRGYFWFRLTDYLLECQFEVNRKLVSGNRSSLIFVSMVPRDDCALSILISGIHEPRTLCAGNQGKDKLVRFRIGIDWNLWFVYPDLILDRNLYLHSLPPPKVLSDLEKWSAK